MSFGGIGKCNGGRSPAFRKTRGTRNWPISDWLNWQAVMEAYTDRLSSVVIESKNALQMLEELDAPDALHYVDPPYVTSTRSKRQAKVYAHEMNEADHRQLAAVLHDLKGMVVLSGYPSKLYDRLYKGWTVATTAAYGEKAVKRTEVLWLNPAAAERQATLQLL
jgi:DNA adenine methylase